MQKLQKKLAIKSFLETTTFHGLFYLDTVKKPLKLLWSLIVLLSSVLIIGSTILMLNKYLKYDYYMITEHPELDRLEEIPNLLVCTSHKLSLVDSIVELKPEFQNSVNLVRKNLSTLDSSASSFGILNYTFIEELKHLFKETKKIDLKECKVNIRSKQIDCIKFKRMLMFTFNGFCLLIDFQELKELPLLLKKEFRILKSYVDYKVHLHLLFSGMKSQSLTVQTVKNQLYADQKFPQTDFELLFKDYNDRVPAKKHFNVLLERVFYDKLLEKRKCAEYEAWRNEFVCHFDCLKRIIREKLKCQFEMNPVNETSDLPYCSLSQLVYIEYLIENYSLFNSSCGRCLPECQSIQFYLQEITGLEDKYQTVQGFDWNFYFEFKENVVKNILNFDTAALLNFLSGLWSLFFGISVLSIWEIVELCNTVTSRKKLKLAKNVTTSLKPFKMVDSILRSAFNDTYLHGFKEIFSSRQSRPFKIRWSMMIVLSTCSFVLSVVNIVSTYRSYDSNLNRFSESIYMNESYLKRNIALFVCLPWQWVNTEQSNFFEKLEVEANYLFLSQNYSTVSEILREYKTKFSFNESQTSLDVYSTLFKQTILKLRSDPEPLTVTADFYLDRTCAWFHLNITLTRLFKDENRKITFEVVNRPLYEGLEYNLLDSESLHLSEDSLVSIIVRNAFPFIIGNLNHQQLLPDPFRPSCNPEKGYKQHKCYQECFNEIIFKEFGCKVPFGQPVSSPYQDYCHPWIIPLVRNYEKYVLREDDACGARCKKPCEYFYYKTEKDMESLINKNKLNNIVKRTTQVPILTFEDVLIVTISYVGLLFGGSLLAILQILFNVIAIAPIWKRYEDLELAFMSKFFPCDLFSQLTTLHCVKYLSSKNKNNYKKLFWLVVILGTLIFAIILSSNEISKFKESKVTSQTLEIQDDEINFPSIDICRIIHNPYYYLQTKPGLVRNVDVFFSSMRSAKNNLDLHYHFLSIENATKTYFASYEEKVFSNARFNDFLKIKWTDLIEEYKEKYMGKLAISNSMAWNGPELLSYVEINSSARIYQTSVLYDFVQTTDNERHFPIHFCKSIKPKASSTASIFKSHFTAIQNKRFGALFQYIGFLRLKDYNLYYDKYLLSPGLDFLGPTGDFKRIDRVIQNYDYKHSCRLTSCIFNTRVLEDFSEHQLFLCNNELRDAIYRVFNCTPFVNRTSGIDICSIPYSMAIHEIMSKYKIELFKCELSTAAFPIQYASRLLPMNSEELDSLVGFDLNNMRYYKQKVVEEFDLLKLVVNVSNWLNVLIGFSFITFCELIFIISIHFKKSYKISSVH